MKENDGNGATGGTVNESVTPCALDRVERTLTDRIAALEQHARELRQADQVAVDAALEAQKEAVLKAEAASEKRFASVNEFRGQLADQQRTFIPRAEAELQFSAIAGRLAKIERLDAVEHGQKAGGKELWAWIVGALGAAVLLWNVFGGVP